MATVYDKVLVSEGFLDKPFASKIGDGSANTTIRVDLAVGADQNPSAPATAAAGQPAAYNLDGAGATGVDWNKATGSTVVHAIITGVTLNDARDLNSRIDGAAVTMGELGPGGGNTAGSEHDLAGRVKYDFTGSATGTTTVYVYLTHR
jgi:hypothetical protein